ncbi:DUF4303 domain-containing protein [Diaphorobacter aerolatus]|uniref:DUF4303 domain-containing protein n=1 Tax=Diaphorobacter aerolatus TaxID=1288495 RepID=A0A7H0GGX8_9BURK|nr:DUF4303 domain-containing protein [Diaphorobacter aerolatus]QNP47544.1 DUF4303 domain-containing protein [Diaphorobacter aerolatus]
MDWNEFETDVFQAAKRLFSKVMNENKDSKFYAFALYTDSDCFTVIPAANTLEAYEEKIASENVNDPMDLAYYKWSTSEWKFEIGGDEKLNGVNKKLRAQSLQAAEKGVFEEFKKQMHSSMINALLLLKNSDCFEGVLTFCCL